MKLIKDSFSDYLEVDHASASALKKIKRSPLHFKEAQETETDVMKFGSMYHTFVLEPEKFEEEYFIFDDRALISKLLGQGSKKPRGTKEYKDWFDDQVRLSNGKITVNQDSFDEICRMKKRLLSNPIAKWLLLSGKKEFSCYGELNGIKVKGRFDSINDDKRFIADLKTVADASENGFLKYCVNFDAQIQAALYVDMAHQLKSESIKPYKFYWVAQEKSPPYAVGIYKASPQMLAVGQYEYEMLIEQWQYIKDNKKYEGYEVFCDTKFTVKEIDLPAYKIKDYSFNNKRK